MAATMGGMAKSIKPKTTPIPIRLPENILPDLDEMAQEVLKSRSAFMADTLVDMVLERRKQKSRAKGKEKG
jgi:metal-responsive CopG/Arc/MetJ family transcriptional regulator